MSFVLQLSPGESGASKNAKSFHVNEPVKTPNTSHLDKHQVGNNEQTDNTSAVVTAIPKSVNVAYPVAKLSKDGHKMAASSTNTSQTLTTRAISQKVPLNTPQSQPSPIILNASSQITNISTKNPSMHSSGNTVTHVYPVQTTVCAQNSSQQQKVQHTSCESKQQTLQTNVLQKPMTSAQQIVATATVKAISTGTVTAISNIQMLQKKPTTGQPQTVNLQKVKTITNVNQSPNQRNSIPRIQAMQKSQVLTTAGGPSTQIVNNTMLHRTQQLNSNTLPKSQVNSMVPQKVQHTYNNQKTPLLNQVNPKHQPQSVTSQQLTQKVQGHTQKVAVQKQQQSTINNGKVGNPVSGLQKSQALGASHSNSQIPKVTQQQKPHSVTTNLHKSQSLATINTNRGQTVTSITKSNSITNIAKMPQNSNVAVGKHPQQIQSGSQLQHQLMHQSQQQQLQKPQSNTTQTVQRTQSVPNVHQKIATITNTSNNQRTASISTSKMQQQMVVRVGVSKSQQNLQQTSVKTLPQKISNVVKSSNSPSVHQALHRNNHSQSVKLIPQPQNAITPQNAQKQPGCIKTIPPQKTVQRNNAQKLPGVKTNLNTIVPSVKSGPAAASTQKASVKTLLPQQTTTSNVLVHKNSPIKIQQQAIQQKQIVMTPQFSQIRQPIGQIKTLMPVTNPEQRKEVESKVEPETNAVQEEEVQISQSPVRRMPLPYECLQFVLQDHNYGAPPPRTPPPPSPPPHPKQQTINGAGPSTPVPQHSFIYSQVIPTANVEDDAASAISSETGREVEPEGEETETAPEGEGDDEDSVTRCICDFEHDDGYMICCDRCLVWQHVDCMGIDRANIPDEYLCEKCRPRRVDKQRARALQLRKREEIMNSDTTSDTSSTSSADTDVGVNSVQKKRALPQVPRRKSESTPQVRRLNITNNNTIGKRQKRDAHSRQSSTVRKKEVAKRGPGKRKLTKRRTSVDEKEEETQDTSWGSNMTPLRQWIERYEEAVTNHYSPELRARISSIKVNGAHSDLRQSNMGIIATGKCKLNLHSNHLRFLVATMYLPPNTPVVELRGKYMLSTQHRPSHPQGRQHAQRPGPFVFFYRLPRDGTEVCVDTRTYGNEARFVRRSCKPNAEVKHCIEKGTLHLYIVTTAAIEKNAEITIKHEQHDLLLSPNSNSPAMPIPCACNNPKECLINVSVQSNKKNSNGSLAENADGRERRRRGRRHTVSEETELTPAVSTPSVTQQQPIIAVTTSPVTAPPRKTVTNITSVASTARPVMREEPMATISTAQLSPNSGQSTPAENKKDKKKLTREERKMEAIMKAFERLEKAEQRKQEVQARNAQRKESGGAHSEDEVIPVKLSKQQSSERSVRRKRRKGRTRTSSSSQSQSTRRGRLNSGDSDISTGDESNSMQSPPISGQSRTTSRDFAHLQTQNKEGPVQSGIPTAAGLLLALANSNAPGPSSPPLQQPAPVKSPTCDSGASSSSQSSTPSTPLSSACLLVAAAVGPLAPGFKFPKTKKVMMNEWLKESPDLPQTNNPRISPVPNTLQMNSTTSNSLNRSSDYSLTADQTNEFLSQNYAAKSLATLVQAANSVSGICDSPPQKKQLNISNNTGSSVITSNTSNISSGSAKKRWLRQAISEECESPRDESPPTNEMVAPPKKRRIARESLSSDNYTPPTTPTMLIPEITSIGRGLSGNEDDFGETSPSSMVEQNDERQNYEADVSAEKIGSKNELIKNNDIDNKKKLGAFDVKLHLKEECVDENSDFEAKPGDDELKCDTVKKEIKFSIEVKRENDLDNYKNDLKIVKPECDTSSFKEIPKKEIIVKKEREIVFEKGTVEIVDQQEPDTEMEDLSSPITAMESDAILKQRVAEMTLEFGGNIGDIVNISSENEKSDDDQKRKNLICLKADEKCNDSKFDDNTSIDEFDVEAQMKKITGDDGNDYKEKVDSSSEKDKSMDGIEGLMESSKEDSDSEDRDLEDSNYEEPFKMFNVSQENRQTKKFESMSQQNTEVIEDIEDKVVVETKHIEQPYIVTSSEESILESTSSNLDINIENTDKNEDNKSVDPPKIFHSIPPLSERIKKKTDTSSNKTKIDFEAAIIESAIDIETGEDSGSAEQKSMLSTALRELLEAKLDDETTEDINNKATNDSINIEEQMVSAITDQSKQISLHTGQNEKAHETIEIDSPKHFSDNQNKDESVPPKEVKRLKDPRTVVPNNMPAPSTFKIDAAPPVKRKLSISEYRKRKQQSSGTPPEPERSNDASSSEKSTARGRSDSASSGTSSLSSDEEGSKTSLSLDVPGLATLPIFVNNENEEKKGGEEGTIGWSAAPTLVERQRENLTERLKREFGLFLSDDEEERARKHGLTTEAILKARKTSPAHTTVANAPPAYPLPQLPPQPYIPPPGSVNIHYPQFQNKPGSVPYSNFATPQTVSQSVYPSTSAQQASTSTKTAQTFIVPTTAQAPPGSNPYNPQLIPLTTTAVPIPKFSSTTPPPSNQVFPTTVQTQKPFFNHPAPRS